MLPGRSIGIVRGRALGIASGLGMARVPARGAAGSALSSGLVVCGPAFSLSGVICLNVWAIWPCCCRRGNGVFGFIYTGQCSGFGCFSCSTPFCECGTCPGGGRATLVALWEGHDGILLDGH